MFNKILKNKYIYMGHPINMRIFSFVILLLVWQVTSFLIKSDVLPSPKTVFIIFLNEIINGEMLYHLGVTLWRVILAFTIAMLVGTGLGIAMGSKKNVNIMLDGWHILLLNTPALVIIILCYVWFGLNEIAAITAVALNKIPNVLVTIREGTRAIDRKILQVADGIGFKLNEFFNLFDIASIFAYTLSFVAVMIFVEYAIISPIERRLNKWRTV